MTKEALQIALKIIQKVIEYPYTRVSKHSVALQIIDELEKNDIQVNEELKAAIHNADDDKALKVLKAL